MLREKPILSLSKLRRLAEIMDERMKAPVVAEVKVKKFSTFVTEWKTAERAALGRSTMQHYSNAFQSYVLPTFGDQDIRSINRKSIQM
jgi:hypothetical protein